jgi:hypothetical protein
MDRTLFWYLHELLKCDLEFQSKEKWPQHLVEYQMTAFFIKYGAISTIRTAGATEISEGCGYVYANHVVEVIWRLCNSFLHSHDYLLKEMKDYGFPGCISMVDGFLFHLKEKLYKDLTSYWCQKKLHAVWMLILHGYFANNYII